MFWNRASEQFYFFYFVTVPTKFFLWFVSLTLVNHNPVSYFYECFMVKNDLDNLRPPWLHFLCKRSSWNWFDMTLLRGRPFCFFYTWFEIQSDIKHSGAKRGDLTSQACFSSGVWFFDQYARSASTEVWTQKGCEVMYSISSLKESIPSCEMSHSLNSVQTTCYDLNLHFKLSVNTAHNNCSVVPCLN